MGDGLCPPHRVKKMWRDQSVRAGADVVAARAPPLPMEEAALAEHYRG